MIVSHGITIIRTYRDAADFDMNRLINQIYKQTSQSNKEKLEKEKKVKINKLKNKIKEQKSKFAKEYLSYVSIISMPVKHIKYFVKKYFPHCKT